MRNHKDTTRHSRNQIYRDELRRECSPPGTGGVDAPSRKCREASFERRGRGGQFGETFRVSDHPVCAASERDLFLNGAATPPVPGGCSPPVPGGEHPRLTIFAHSRKALSNNILSEHQAKLCFELAEFLRIHHRLISLVLDKPEGD